MKVFDDALFDSEIKNSKFKMADSIWLTSKWIKMQLL